MSNIETILTADPPRRLKETLENWPLRGQYHPSPSDWRDEVLYFLLPDRFSDGREQPGKLLDCDLTTPEGLQRIRGLRGDNWRWDHWQNSGAGRFQGGMLAGVLSKLDYLSNLGVTTS